MKKIFKNYKSTILLLGGIILGAIVGLVFKEKTEILKPFGAVFLNLLFVIIIPLIFLTISVSVANLKEPKRLGKIIFSTFFVFLVTTIIACLIGLATTINFELVSGSDSEKIKNELRVDENIDTSEDMNVLAKTAEVLTVDDFSKILSKDNLIALVIFSLLIGVAINKSKEAGKQFLEVLESAKDVCLKFIDIIMIYAPFGLGCYFAALIGTFGSSIAIGYLKTFIIYTVVAILYFVIIYSLYALIAGGKTALKKYWQNILPAAITSLSTCSSAASIPVNIKCAKKIGVKEDVANTVIPLGTSFHKDGSVIGSVFKIMFLAYLFNMDISSSSVIFKIVITALVANLLVVAVPIGGGTISEMLIISLMGYPVLALPILTVIATIIDAPATLLNVVGDTNSSMLVSRLVDKKKWLT